MTCSICESDASPYCSAKILGKYDVEYYRCRKCHLIFCEKPYWIEEAYSSAITKLDIGLVMRNELMAPIVTAVINKWFNPASKFIDYGGGYGMLVRMMRDRGFDYYRQDIYCENLYAEAFDISDLSSFKSELLTAFEVFEHLTDPVGELEKMLSLTDTILFSTDIQPFINPTPESWWYFTPETGQHLSLYSRDSLKILADRFKLNYCWNEQNIHLFSRKPINNKIFKFITHPKWGKLYNDVSKKRESLLNKDFLFIQNRLRESFLPPVH